MPYEKPEIKFDKFQSESVQLENNGLYGVQCIDPISVLHDLCSEEDFIVWVCFEKEIVNDFLQKIEKNILKIYNEFALKDYIENFWVSGLEYLCPPLAAPDIFYKIGVKYNKNLFNMLRANGKKTLLHCHGRIYDILDGIKELKPSGVHPIEPPPIGNCSLKDARNKLSDNTVLIGNIEYYDLKSIEKEYIDSLVKKAIDDAGMKIFILSPSCTPFAKKIDKKLSENYIQMIKSGDTYGKF